MERFRPTPKQEANKLGGSDREQWKEYIKKDEAPYCDKRDHNERSKAHQPNHKKHK